jgi:hypothetical protein
MDWVECCGLKGFQLGYSVELYGKLLDSKSLEEIEDKIQSSCI